MSEHAWFEEHLAGYSAGGLKAEDRERFERHSASCKDCARSLDDWAGFDRSLDGLFADVRPELGMENRLLQGLRTAPAPRHWRWTKSVRLAAAIAALVMLGVIGALLQRFVENGNLSFPGLWAEGPKDEGYYDPARTRASNNLKQLDLFDVSGSMTDSLKDRIDPNDLYNITARPSGGDGRQEISLGGSVRSLGENGTPFTLLESERQGGRQKKLPPERTAAKGDADGDGRLDVTNGEFRERFKAHYATSETGKRIQCATECVESFGFSPATSNQPAKQRIQFAPVFVDPLVTSEIDPAAQASNKDINYKIDRKAEFSVPGMTNPIESIGILAPPGVDGKKITGSDAAYFKPAAESPKVVYKTVYKTVTRSFTETAKTTVAVRKAQNNDSEVALGEKGKPPGGKAPDRKIVRTGDIEYEVDSFDTAVERINKLIDAVQGAFVATTNSDKLPNGKMKGSVVVRMPPESLDKFLLDLRKDLGKTGDLKSLRIGSQDITKQYTDVDSRLRAAKTMEERLLKIIKGGKGDIKDLIAAEHELGLWRTKIEEMEGEIRYYNNQVSLSKLTIGLVEKEIQAASALEITEKIKMRIEVEEVEKAQDTVLEEVKKVKGRIIKSELKLHGAGQLEAIMNFEAAPKEVPGLRKILRQIGNITKDEAERQQTAVGGTEPAGNIKPQVKDTNFEVRLYNLANIQPRETLTLTVATLDVPGSYKKLQDAVKGKGQVRRGQFNEQDKLNISAFFDFDLNVKDRSAIDKVLADVGKEIGRSTDQAQPSDSVTDQKVGYRLTLRSVASIPPREKITLAIEVRNVEKTTTDMVEAVKSSKGLVATGPLFSQDAKGQFRAVILFDVPFAAKDELVRQFKADRTVRVQKTEPNPKVPENELATAHIDVVLTSVGPIIPSDDAVGPQIRRSLFYSFKIFSISLSFVLWGILAILPPALVLIVAYKLVRKWRKTKTAV